MTTRRRLPDTRNSIVHKVVINGHKIYIIVGLFEDETPGELFIITAKEGSTIRGLLDTVGILTSMALQSGVDLEIIVRKLRGTMFEPQGWCNNPEQPNAASIIDYVFTWLGRQFCPDVRKEYEALQAQRGEA
jgi:ribonucleoside-diphosphate reductase alpha chain